MFKNNALILGSTLVVLALLSACSNDDMVRDMAQKPENFRADPGTAKIYLYVSYDNPEDKPDFGETFRVRIDGGYIGDIDGDKQYIVTQVPPGKRTVDVEELVWSGNTASRLTLEVPTTSGESSFVYERIIPDQKPVLSTIGTQSGMNGVMARTRACLCGW